VYVSVPNSQQLFAASKVSVDSLLIADQLQIEDLQDPEAPSSINAADFPPEDSQQAGELRGRGRD
jgi:hypothetical protein